MAWILETDRLVFKFWLVYQLGCLGTKCSASLGLGGLSCETGRNISVSWGGLVYIMYHFTSVSKDSLGVVFCLKFSPPGSKTDGILCHCWNSLPLLLIPECLFCFFISIFLTGKPKSNQWFRNPF